jgi:hypothetical protein
MKNLKLLFQIFFFLIISTQSAFAARIVVSSDEWLTSNTGFAIQGMANGTTFAQNLAAFLKGTAGAGNFLIYTDSFGLAESNFQTALTSVGNTVSFLLSTNALPADLSPYDGIFLSGLTGTATSTVLTEYANANNGVFISAGNGFTPNVEANRWNAFLNNFGLTLSTTYNGIQGNVAVAGGHPIFAGVSQLYFDNGNNVSIVNSNPLASVVLTGMGGEGLIGVYDTAAVPEPATLALLSVALFGAARRKRAQ